MSICRIFSVELTTITIVHPAVSPSISMMAMNAHGATHFVDDISENPQHRWIHAK